MWVDSHLVKLEDHAVKSYFSRSNAALHSYRSLSAQCDGRLAILLSFVLLAAAHATAAVVVAPTSGLIGYWSGDSTAADSSPVGNNGSFGGSYVSGRPGGDAAFDLSSANVVIPNNPVYDNFQNDPGWTVGLWFNTNGIAPNSTNDLFLGQDNGSGFQPKWFIDYGYTVFGPNTDFVWHVNDSNQERIFLTSDSINPLPAGWNQLTVVIDNANRVLDFYLNGLPIGTDSLPNYVLETTAPLIFGEAEGFTFGGFMNDVAIYDRALSPQDVTELVDSTQPIPESSSTFLVMITAGMFVGSRRFGRRNPT